MKQTNKLYTAIFHSSIVPFMFKCLEKNDNIMNFHSKCTSFGNYAILWLEYSKTLYCWSSGKIKIQDDQYGQTC